MADIDLDLRPKSYFNPQRLERYLLSKVKGAVIRGKLQTLFEEGKYSEVRDLVGTTGISTSDRKALEAIHPAFMGGNYLPDADYGEVEIARIRIASTTYDVTSAFAKADKGVIRYRVVDEYDGQTLTKKTRKVSEKPLTLGELTNFLLKAYDLVGVLQMNRAYDKDLGLEFFSVQSDFYPELDRLVRQRVTEKIPELAEEDEEDG